MKQRTRIRHVKDVTYPAYIYCARQRRRWAEFVVVKMRKFSDALREAYEKARRENEVPAVRSLGAEAGDAHQPSRQHDAA